MNDPGRLSRRARRELDGDWRRILALPVTLAQYRAAEADLVAQHDLALSYYDLVLSWGISTGLAATLRCLRADIITRHAAGMPQVRHG